VEAREGIKILGINDYFTVCSQEIALKPTRYSQKQKAEAFRSMARQQ